MSVFNGREPDEHRADLDLGPLDSLSGRLTFMPTSRLAVQISAAHLRDAEAEFPPEPRKDVDPGDGIGDISPSRGARHLGDDARLGRECQSRGDPGRQSVYLVTHAVLLESSFSPDERHTWFGRAEVVGKPGHDLHVHEAPATVFTVGKLQGGYVWSLPGRQRPRAGRRRDGVGQLGSAGSRPSRRRRRAPCREGARPRTSRRRRGRW